MEKNFEKNTFAGRMSSMLRVDSRRMFMRPLFYIILGIAVIMPIVILVMTGMMDGTPITDAQTGEQLYDGNGEPMLREGFDSVWQIIGSTSADAVPDMSAGMAGMEMDMTSMCNIDLLYFGVAVLICIFISDDFRSGYSKNLFTVRAKRSDYVISKIAVCTAAGALLVAGFLLGALIGGAVAGLSFGMQGFGVGNLVFCILGKMLIMGMFAGIYSLMAVIAKQRLWLSILLSFGVGMFLFNIVPIVAPLDSSLPNVIFSAAGGVLIGCGTGALSRLILSKRAVI